MGEVFKNILQKFNNENFSIPNYNQEPRYYAISVLIILLEYSNETFFNKYEYLQIVLDAIDGEKDPRNIVLMFNLIYQVNTVLKDISPFTNKFFEILDDYFPIEFKPPTNSPQMITAEQLSNRLNDCFCSNEAFMEYLIDSIKGKTIII
jgi:DNA repair/transcription protein MET18/MMS19